MADFKSICVISSEDSVSLSSRINLNFNLNKPELFGIFSARHFDHSEIKQVTHISRLIDQQRLAIGAAGHEHAVYYSKQD